MLIIPERNPITPCAKGWLPRRVPTSTIADMSHIPRAFGKLDLAKHLAFKMKTRAGSSGNLGRVLNVVPLHLFRLLAGLYLLMFITNSNIHVSSVVITRNGLIAGIGSIKWRLTCYF